MNQILSMMSLTNLGLTPSPLVCTLSALFICVMKSLLLVFWGLTFPHQWESSPLLVFFHLAFLYQKESSPKVVNSLQSFNAQIADFSPNFKINFIVIVWICAHSISNWFFSPKTWNCTLQWATYVNLLNLLVGFQTPAPLFGALMVENPKSTNHGVTGVSVSVTRCRPTRS